MKYVTDPGAPRDNSHRRLLVANLDAELDWAREALGTHAKLPRDVEAAAAAAGAMMMVFARAGDRLWLPCAVNRQRLSEELTNGVELCTGDIDAITDDMDELVCWGWTSKLSAGLSADGAPPTACVAHWNDRRTSLALEQELAIALPQSRVLGSQDEVAEALATWPHPLPWVLKAPFSASGRARIRRRGAPEKDAKVRTRRLLDRFGVLVLEPWYPRTADCACIGTVGDDGWALEAPHRLEVDGNGVFRAIEIGEQAVPIRLANELRRVAGVVAERMHEGGFRGPFGIDAFSYENSGECLRPLCEINARLTFGHIASAARRRHAGGAPQGFRLQIARDKPTDGSWCLLTPDAPDQTSVVCG